MKKGRLFLDMLLHPIFLIIYGVAWFHLSELCQYGGKQRHLGILIACLVFFVLYLVLYISIIIVKPVLFGGYRKDAIVEDDKVISKIYHILAILLLVGCTAFYGRSVYHSAQGLNGKLSWFMKDLDTRRYIKLSHDNFYQDGIDGLLSDIDKKLDLPDSLYVVNNVKLRFDKDGTITAFDTFLYGKNKKGRTESYLINYDRSNSDDISVYEKGFVNPTYSADKKLAPLKETLHAIDLKQVKRRFQGKSGALLYYGKRSFGFNIQGIMYIDSIGNTKAATKANKELKGYFVSIYDPSDSAGSLTTRYELVKEINNIPAEKELAKNEVAPVKYSVYDASCSLGDKASYRLCVVDAAAGTRFYSLAKSIDDGASWKFINKDPFNGEAGAASGVTFITEKLGFIGLTNVSKTEGKLYRTEDGGKSFKEVSISKKGISVKGDPFDTPEMPRKEEGRLILYVGQGSDGDYNQGIKAKFESKDNGKTFTFVSEENKE